MTDPLDRDAAKRQGNGPSRLFSDQEGRRWIVREVGPSSYDRRSRPSLIFETDGVMRRVFSYPPNWTDLAEDDLIVLSHGL